jgi:hypothetical protein
MHDQEIDARGGGLLERPDTGIDRCADLGHVAIVGDLQAIAGTGRIFEGGAAGAGIAVADEILQGGHGGLVCCGWAGVGSGG